MTTATRPEGRDAEDDGGSLTGRVLGDFSVLKKLGPGGVGAAYRANQALLGREALIKVLHAGTEADGFTQSRFLREARLASRIDHPFAVHIFAFGAEPDGLLWIAMELVRGVPLSAWIKTHGPMPLAQFAPFFDTLCDVVDAVHEKGIVHRDLKPSNVMVMERNGRLLPKLLDLGIATVITRASAEKGSADEAAFLDLRVHVGAVRAVTATREGRTLQSRFEWPSSQQVAHLLRESRPVVPLPSVIALSVSSYHPMPTWSSHKPTMKKVNPELQALANDFELKGGRVAMPAAAFKAWLLKHRTLSTAGRKQRAKELIALAARFGRKGAPTFDAVAQLCVLAGDALTPHAVNS